MKFFLRKFPKASGFTLIELLVVIAIIGLLSSVVLSSLSNARAKARDARRISELAQIRKAIDFYYDANNAYPAIPSGCGAVTWARSDTAACWTGASNSLRSTLLTWMATMPVDPKNTGNNVYAYQPANGTSGFRLATILENTTNVGTGCYNTGGGPTGFPGSYYCVGVNW